MFAPKVLNFFPRDWLDAQKVYKHSDFYFCITDNQEKNIKFRVKTQLETLQHFLSNEAVPPSFVVVSGYIL